MTNTFKELSHEIADNFIKTVVFFDDEAYSKVVKKDQKNDLDDPKNDFDAQKVNRLFTERKKICSIFKPESEADIKVFCDMAVKADVTVLDWQINIQGNSLTSDESGEEDADDDDIRGKYTKNIISHLLNSKIKRNSLKLILVYTGETDLAGIAKEISQHLEENKISDFSISEADECCVQSPSCKISVIAKSNGGAGRGKHNSVLQDKQVTYDELPDFITREFAKMTSGLLPNFALQSLSVIRDNFFQILNLFSKELDAAYLAHKSLLPNIDDANELLVELLGDTFTSILRTKNLNNSIDNEVIEKWIDEHILDVDTPKLNKFGDDNGHTFTRSKELLKELLKPNSNVEAKFKDVLSPKDIGNISKNFKKYAFTLFHPNDISEKPHETFVKLCQHKDLIKFDNHLPALSLGTVVRSTKSQEYYVCIQQPCDSVRLEEEEKRRFLFLTLKTVEDDNGKFDFLTPDDIKLKLEKKTYHLRTVKFERSTGGKVEAKSENDRTYFIPSHYNDVTERFEFIFELKDLNAQRIVENYSSQLSRVGLDEPEWVR